MVIFLAALKGVPQDLYEAASIDGAGKVASVLLCDSADHYTGYFLQPGNTALSGVPGVQRTVHHHTGRTEKLYNTDFALDLQTVRSNSMTWVWQVRWHGYYSSS